MADDEDEDLYDEEFDFVDEDEEEDEEEDGYEEESTGDESDLTDEPAAAPVRERGRGTRDHAAEAGDERDSIDGREADGADASEEPVDEYGRPEPAANYVVHLYEARKLLRTIDRPFTPEDAEAFASEFNRTNKNYNRFAITGKNDAKPKKTLDEGTVNK